jgi:transposase
MSERIDNNCVFVKLFKFLFYQIFKQSLHPKRLTHIVLLTIFLLACSNPDFLYQLFSVHFQ